ncbi:MAG TPA: cation diffusion facilitator family transporter [Campylobacterales bacterium]|nr:cation diffusion facilitator family transporter [Campylobacterales bacterium]
MTLQKKATVVASATAFFLIVIKLTVGIMTGTVVIIASAIDSALDFLISLFNSYAITKSQKPMDTEYNYGRGKIEGLASMTEGIVIIASGLFIIYAAVDKFIHQAPTTHLGLSLGVMAVSIVATTFLVLFLNLVYKKTNNLIIKSDALHYKSDLYTNVGIIVSLGLIYLTDWGFIDPIVSIAIAVYIIYSATEIVKDGLGMLLDKALEHETVEKIQEIIGSHVRAKECIISGYHQLKTRKSGSINFVDVHLVFNDKVLLRDSHELADHIEERIIEIHPNESWIINIHQDPYDDGNVNIKVAQHK